MAYMAKSIHVDDSAEEHPLSQGAARVLRVAKRETRRLFRLATYPLRGLPDFVIIGAQKCGTTSLHNYLNEHPMISAGFPKKELHFFDINYNRGVSWYRSSFPTSAYERWVVYRRGFHPLVGESSPYYLFHPNVPHRMKQLIPDAKLVVLLRNPVDRAISHYSHSVRRGYESLGIRDAFDIEEDRLRGEREKLIRDPSYHSFDHQHHSYLSRGCYAEQLEQWFLLFPRDQFFVIQSEDLFESAHEIVAKTCRFLGCEPRSLSLREKYNQFPYQEAPSDVYEWLIRYFTPHNRRLSDLLGRTFRWT